MAAQGQGGGEAGPGRTDRIGLGPRFLVLPAVDLLGEEAVRLEQGDFDRVSLRAGDPETLVARFAAARPAFVHVVDLGGARSGQIRPELAARLPAPPAPP